MTMAKMRLISLVCIVWRERSVPELMYIADLREQYEVRMDEGLDTFVVVDGLPKVPPASKEKLTKFSGI